MQRGRKGEEWRGGEREGEGCREEGRERNGEGERERGKKGGKERKRKKSRSSHVMFMTKDDTGTWMSGKFSRGISFLTQSDSAHKVGLA